MRLTVANQETLVANAIRRALQLGEDDAVPRVSDLEALAASTSGKVEIETLEEGRDGEIIERLVKSAVLTVFRDRVGPERLRDITIGFEDGAVVHAGDDVRSEDYIALFKDLPDLQKVVDDLVGATASAAELASAIEFILEGLHLSKRLNKDAVGTRATYRAR